MARYATIALVFVFVGGVCGGIEGCNPEAPQELQGESGNPGFSTGQLVESVVSGERGQVLGGEYRSDEKVWYYSVRFAVNRAHLPRRVLGSGGPVRVAPLTAVWLWEFELRECAE